MNWSPAPHAEQPAARVRIDVDACLALRPASVPCQRCRVVCPTAALDWHDDAVRITGDCLGCGRCAAACPSGALQIGGFELTPPAPGSLTLPVECRRVPSRLRRAGAAVVPCLGGISVGHLLEWRSAGRATVLVDRGWCGDCKAGGEYARSTRQIVDRARAELWAVQAGNDSAPRIETDDLPARLALPLPESPAADGPPLGRRAFFASLRQPAATAATLRVRPQAAVTRAACAPSATLRTTLARRASVLTKIASRAGRTLSAASFASLHASAECRHEGVCAAACPSGALARVEGADAQVGLAFDAEFCLACGLCTSLCPHGALTLQPAGDAQAVHQPGPRALTRHALGLCRRCDAPFVAPVVAPGADLICPLCAMAERQARHLFGWLPAGGAQRSAPS